MRKPKQQTKPLNDLSRSLTPFDPNQTLICVIELSNESWLVAGIIPGVERQPLKKLDPNENELLKLLERWRTEAEKAGHKINRIAVAFEVGRDGFWLARWLLARGIEAHVIHAASDRTLFLGQRRDHALRTVTTVVAALGYLARSVICACRVNRKSSANSRGRP
jgi:hypothetical protein